MSEYTIITVKAENTDTNKSVVTLSASLNKKQENVVYKKSVDNTEILNLISQISVAFKNYA